MEKSILLIDDEENIRKYLGYTLEKQGYGIQTACYGKEGLRYLTQKHFDIILLDLNLPDIDGLEVLQKITKIDVKALVVIITAFGNIESAVNAIKLGAFDYLAKPFDVEDIKLVIEKAFKVIGLEDQIQILERQVDRFQYGELITRSQKMHGILKFVENIAVTETTAMIYGETGTGKELIASLIHKNSNRAAKPFITIDCTSLPENLLESELFGHEKGSFTGAHRLKRGLFELAPGGVVFLDEIGELPLTLQSKLLRVLDSKTFRRVGGEYYMSTDARIIAATNRNLKKMVKEETFRSDLLYRLDVLPIYLPPLRERSEDIFPLVEYFIQFYNKKIGKKISDITSEAVSVLVDYQWPGNIRELKNVIEHCVITCPGQTIQRSDLSIQGKSPDTPSLDSTVNATEDEPGFPPDFQLAKKKAVERFETAYLTKLLAKYDWNISESARRIGMHRGSFQRLIRKYGLRETKIMS
ncbi:MAG: sigma-54 dependent transcriptional regulator [Pseudomonadota bacterium]